MIILPEDKRVIEKLSACDVKALLLALLSDAESEFDLSCLSLAAEIVYLTISEKNQRISRRQSSNGSKGGRPRKLHEDAEGGKPTESQESHSKPENPEKPKKAKKASGTVTESGTDSVTSTDTDYQETPPDLPQGEEEVSVPLFPTMPTEAVVEERSTSKPRRSKPQEVELVQRVFAEYARDHDNSESLLATLQDFVRMRDSMRRPLTERAALLLCRELDKFGAEGYAPVPLLEESIAKSWLVVYRPKPDYGTGLHPPPHQTNRYFALAEEMEEEERRAAAYDGQRSVNGLGHHQAGLPQRLESH